MNFFTLFKQLLPGMIPILVYIVADELWGTTVGLIVAIGFGILEGGIGYLRYRKIDRFILFDIALLSALGGVSILLESDTLFRLKPAIINAMILLLLGVSVFSSKNIMLNMSARYMKGMEINDAQRTAMRNMLLPMFYIFTAYTLLSFYSVWYMSKETWAFINSALLYIVFGVYFAGIFIYNRYIAPKLTEYLPVVSPDGKIIGKASRKQCHSNKELLHPVVHLHVLNYKGELYLQKRPMNKKIQPGKWDTAVGGHIDFNESLETALRRETREEIGLTDFKAALLNTYVWESAVERELVYTFVTFTRQKPTPHPKELDGGMFWDFSDVEAQAHDMTPNLMHELNWVKEFAQKNKPE